MVNVPILVLTVLFHNRDRDRDPLLLHFTLRRRHLRKFDGGQKKGDRTRVHMIFLSPRKENGKVYKKTKVRCKES